MLSFKRRTFWRGFVCFFIAILIVFLFGALVVKEERLVAAMNQMVNMYPDFVKQAFTSSDECTYGKLLSSD